MGPRDRAAMVQPMAPLRIRRRNFPPIQSGRGLPQSKTCGRFVAPGATLRVLDCGRPQRGVRVRRSAPPLMSSNGMKRQRLDFPVKFLCP
jgi:hypothetical protein